MSLYRDGQSTPSNLSGNIDCFIGVIYFVVVFGARFPPNPGTLSHLRIVMSLTNVIFLLTAGVRHYLQWRPTTEETSRLT